MRSEARLRQEGFTLLETMIAISIMLVAFASILMVESGSINTTTKARQMNTVAMLARNLLVETEYAVQGKSFNEVKKEESGEFKEPFQDYKWERKVREIKFPALQMASGAGGDKGDDGGSGGGGLSDMVTKLMTNFLSKAVREITVTIRWKKGSGEQTFAVSTYWVDLNHEFAFQ